MQYASLSMIMRVRAEMSIALDQELQATDDSANIFNLNGIFRDVSTPLYIDYVHVSGQGNEIVARQIVDILRATICLKAATAGGSLDGVVPEISCETLESVPGAS